LQVHTGLGGFDIGISRGGHPHTPNNFGTFVPIICGSGRPRVGPAVILMPGGE
jgi:hypothetical protein